MPNLPKQPWYREPWPWFLMALPLTAVIASLITIVLAVKSQDGLVADDYYKEGMAINKTLDRDHAAQALGLRAQLTLADNALRIQLDGRMKLYPSGLHVRLIHPTQPGRDHDFQLHKSGPTVYAAAIDDPLVARDIREQRWQVIVEPPQAEWRLTGRWSVATETIHLGVSSEVQ